MSKPDLDVIKTHFATELPYAAALNLTFDELTEGRAVMTMPYDARLVGDPETGVIHGGAVSALMDTCCGAAVFAHPEASMGTATIDLRIDYMRAAVPGKAIVASAHCYHVTRSVAFVRATATDGESETPVAAATGAFTVDRKEPKA